MALNVFNSKFADNEGIATKLELDSYSRFKFVTKHSRLLAAAKNVREELRAASVYAVGRESSSRLVRSWAEEFVRSQTSGHVVCDVIAVSIEAKRLGSGPVTARLTQEFTKAPSPYISKLHQNAVL